MNPIYEGFTPGEVTQMLVNVRAGDESALNRLLPLVYDELRKIASSYLSQEHSSQTIQTSDLVHEAYLRLAEADVTWQNRAHFFGIAARSMRQILVDYARRRNAEKRGGGMTRVSLTESVLLVDEDFSRLLMLDDALKRLEQVDSRLCKVVEMRYFSGLTIEETAEALSVSARTVENDWNLAKAWLFRTMSS
ncbi:MAG TPA: sigma-70 family RNA polymerase sigma factor [Bacteroidota bacterium]|nr:sigma-70 family RNA polymerase sigma factor [Bacteroidota bacterium]